MEMRNLRGGDLNVSKEKKGGEAICVEETASF